jgi:hypothetical protein
MRLEEDVRLPPAVEQGWPSQFHRALSLFLVRVSRQVNLMSEGKITGASNALTAAPTTGTFVVGDFVRNSTPSEAGAGGSKYVVFGWTCTAAGTPGTWLPLRCLTGN